MKIAIQLFGHLRTFRECQPYLNKYISNLYDCDLFIHTWDTEEHSDKTWHTAHTAHTEQKKETDKNELIELYQPKKILIENNSIITEPGFFGTNETVKISLKGIKSMLYSMNKVNELRNIYEKDTGKSYDYIIMIRPDILLLESLNLSNYLPEFLFKSNTSIHFFRKMDCSYKEEKFYSYPIAMDVFFIANSNTMNKLSSLYYEFHKYYIDILSITPKGVENPETSFYEYCIDNQITPRFYKNNYIINREDKTKNVFSLADEDRITIPKEFGIQMPKTKSKVFAMVKLFVGFLSKNQQKRLLGKIKLLARLIESNKYE